MPEVLDWCDDPCNTVGTEYIITPRARGVNLRERWPSMDAVQHMECVKSLAQLACKMTKLRFPAYGSLYLDDAPVQKSSVINLGNGFLLGPRCGQAFGPLVREDEGSNERVQLNCGPHKSVMPRYANYSLTGRRDTVV